VLPQIDLKTVKMALDREKYYNSWFPYVDYGLDLEDLT
jgi:hypothetical protein